MNLILKVHTKLSLLFALSAILLLVPALSSAQERIAFSASADNNSDIWSTNTDGTDPKRLTNNAASDIEPSFSADGGKIVFVSFRSSGWLTDRSEIAPQQNKLINGWNTIGTQDQENCLKTNL